MRERVVSLADLGADEPVTVRGRARVAWLEEGSRRVPAVAAVTDLTLQSAVNDVQGLVIRGSTSLAGLQVPGDPWSALFGVRVMSPDGEELASWERRLEVASGTSEPFEVMVDDEDRGPGQVILTVSYDPAPPAAGGAAWIDPEIGQRLLVEVEAPRAPFNLVIVTLDTTRRDALDLYGGAARTHALRRLAGDGVLFRGAHSAAYGTAPSHASLFTGSHPRQHGVYDNRTVLGEEMVTLAEELLAAGYRTAAFVGGRPVSHNVGLRQGFLVYDDLFLPDPQAGLGRFAQHERRAEVTVDRFLDRFAELEEPFAVWLHFFDPHQPYAPPGTTAEDEPPQLSGLLADDDGNPKYVRMDQVTLEPSATEALVATLDRRYVGEIEQVDAQLARVLAVLDQRGVYERTLIVVVSDHGENSFERGRGLAYRHAGLHHDVTQLALVVKLPDSRHRGTQRDFLLLNSDIPCFILDLIGRPAPVSWTCRSFLPMLDRPDATFRPHLVLEGAHRQEVAVRDATFLFRMARPSFLEADPPAMRLAGFSEAHPARLFDLARDPQERADLAGRDEYRGVVAAMRARVEGFERAPATTDAPLVATEQHVEGLRALGYLQ